MTNNGQIQVAFCGSVAPLARPPRPSSKPKPLPLGIPLGSLTLVVGGKRLTGPHRLNLQAREVH